MPILATEEKGSTNYMIAFYILKHADELQDATTSSLALACNVSKASISRFCKYIGLEDFYTLKHLIKTNQRIEVPKIDGCKDLFSNFRYSLTQLENNIKNHDLKQLISDIHASSHVVLMGTPETFGPIISLQQNLSTLGKIVTVCIQPQIQESCLLNAKENDTIICFSQESDYLRQVITKPNRMSRPDKPTIYSITLKASTVPTYIDYTYELGLNSPFVFGVYTEVIYEEYRKYIKMN